MEEPILCAYCNEPITTPDSINKFFPEEGIHKKVHGYHLFVKNRKGNNEVQTPGHK
jgi:hypothetical protein